MAHGVNLWAGDFADITSDDSNPALSLQNISTGPGVRAGSLGAAPAISAIVSGASGTVLKVSQIGTAFVSTNSTASLSYALRVDVSGKIFFVPAYLGAA